MSYYDYKISREIAGRDYPFYALIMAAMRKADTGNLRALQAAFPEAHKELQERYHAPGGLLESEREETHHG